MKLPLLTLMVACDGGASRPPPVTPSAPPADAGVQIRDARSECRNRRDALRDPSGSEPRTLPPDAVVVLPPDFGRQSPNHDAELRLRAALAKLHACDARTPAPSTPEPRPAATVASPFASGQGGGLRDAVRIDRIFP